MRIHAISVSKTKGVRKDNVAFAELRPDHGIVNDAHAGTWHRQVSLLAKESIDQMIEKGLRVGPGDFAENITTEGVDLTALPIGGRMRLGTEVLVEVTQKGKTCHDRCEIFYKAGDCVMPREGIFVRVLSGGTIYTGDSITCLGGSENDEN
jgi:molybdopterin adenylyltransferase